MAFSGRSFRPWGAVCGLFFGVIMARPKTLRIENWNEYQARTDKELPWLKLWGKLFLRDWWQGLEDDLKIIPIIFLDVSRRFNNRLPPNYDYYKRNYNLKTDKNKFLKCCKLLSDIGFLSDVMSDSSPSPSPSPSKYNRKEEKKKFGESGSVLLTDLEHDKLIENFGQAGALSRITRLENYILSTGKRYKSHYHTILNWETREKTTAASGKFNPSAQSKDYSLENKDFNDKVKKWKQEQGNDSSKKLKVS